MNKAKRLSEYKTRASILIKQLKGTNAEQQLKAANRFLQLPFLKHSSANAVVSDIDFFRLKHAYAVIAIENGCDNWNTLRENTIIEDCMYTTGCGVYLNVWFNNYEEASAYRNENGGYLLRYRKDYFVAEQTVIAVLGLDHLEQEWAAIGYDWVKPKSKDDWQKIYVQAKENYLKPAAPYTPPNKDKRPAWLNN